MEQTVNGLAQVASSGALCAELQEVQERDPRRKKIKSVFVRDCVCISEGQNLGYLVDR